MFVPASVFNPLLVRCFLFVAFLLVVANMFLDLIFNLFLSLSLSLSLARSLDFCDNSFVSFFLLCHDCKNDKTSSTAAGLLHNSATQPAPTLDIFASSLFVCHLVQDCTLTSAILLPT